MGYCLTRAGAPLAEGWAKRFDPSLWTVDFPRPMLASATTIGKDTVRVDARFYRRNDLAGLIWSAADPVAHPVVAYRANRDFRGCVLRFRWRSGGLKPLDMPHGPTLTIEGRDTNGAPRTWLVRLWNYAQGSGADAAVRIDFDNLREGYAPGGGIVFAGDIDRMFISLVADDYDMSDVPLALPMEGWAELSGICCDGPGSMLRIGDGFVPEHKLRMATGYDDLYHLTPERALRTMLQLGYRGVINHYVGMSHYMALGLDGLVRANGPVLAGPCTAWHRDFAQRASVFGYDIIWSLSYEVLAQHCPDAWQQRAADGSPARTGWDPPSALLSPANGTAMGWLQDVARAFADIAVEGGARLRFQIGEPWWWVRADGTICIYDAAAAAAFAPVPIANVRGNLNAAQKASLDAAGACLAASTAALADVVRAVDADAEILLLAFLPTVLDGEDVKRANLPAGWARPAFDVLQLEDYDWVTAGRTGASARGIAEAQTRLGYPPQQQHYLAGFVLNGADRAQWQAIAEAAERGFARGVAETFVWALPQVLRDGFTWFGGEEEVAMEPFADVRFPVAIGREASVEPAFSTAIVIAASGAEKRNADWSDARLSFDAGPGVRSEADMQSLIAFFRARRGAAQAFRFEDPFDHDAMMERIGHGDGQRTDFALVKDYDGQERRITRPVAGSVRLFVDGVEKLNGWTLGSKGMVRFAAAAGAGAEIQASFRFDVPVRFAEDRLSISRATFLAGEAASVKLIEVRE